MKDSVWEVNVHYGGTFQQQGRQRRYVGGSIKTIDLERDRSNFKDLSTMLLELDPDNLTPAIFYDKPNKLRALGVIQNDEQMMEMFDATRGSFKIELYVLMTEVKPVQAVLSDDLYVVSEPDATFSDNSSDDDDDDGDGEGLEEPSKRGGRSDVENVGGQTGAAEIPRVRDWSSDSSACLTADTSSDEEHVRGPKLMRFFDSDKHLHDPDLSVGLLFADRQLFRRALQQYCIKKSFDIKYKYNSKRRISAHCKTEGCKWRIHASVRSDNQGFQIRILNGEHSASCKDSNLTGNHQATQSWICTEILDRLRVEPDWSINGIKDHFLTTYGLTIPYKRMWRGRQRCLEKIFGSSYAPHYPRGRPRKQRKCGEDEEVKPRRTKRCKRCNRLGHNTRTCKEPIPSQAGQSTTRGGSLGTQGRGRNAHTLKPTNMTMVPDVPPTQDSSNLSQH